MEWRESKSELVEGHEDARPMDVKTVTVTVRTGMRL